MALLSLSLRRSLPLLVLAMASCSSPLTTLTVRKTTPQPLTLVPGPQLSERSVKRILLLPPEEGVTVSDRVESLVAREKRADYYTAKLEKILLAKGFEVVAHEMVARATSQVSGRSAAERALQIGQKTQADAVLSVQSLRVEPGERFFHRPDLREVPPRERQQDDDGNYFHRDTEQCLFRLPTYQLSVAAKLIDVQNGDVLWVGEGSEQNLDALPRSWVAKLDDECQVREQAPYNYRDYLASEEAFESTANDLLMRLIEPLRVRVLNAARPLVKAEPPKAQPTSSVAQPAASAAPTAQVKPATPGARTATVSSGRAILRDLPQDDSLKIRLVERRAKVEVMQSSGQWHKIKLEDGTVGWMNDDHLLVDH